MYFLAVFALGFALGIPRVLVLAPSVGELVATLIELPCILAASWFICRWVIRRHAVPADPATRLLMGALAFGLVMLAELGLSVLLFGWSVQEHLSAFRDLPTALGLLAQIGFGLMPWLQRAPARPAS